MQNISNIDSRIDSQGTGFRACKTAIVALVLGLVLSLSLAITAAPEKAHALEGDTYTAEIKVKDYGTIKLKLCRNAAPETVDNFVKLANNHFYDGLTFHRVISGFMMQGGCPYGTGSGGSGTKIKGEFSKNNWKNPITHKRGVISMARPGGNPETEATLNGASSQFFIVHKDQPNLDGSYAPFGYVTSGMDVVDKICAIPVKSDKETPVNKPVIESIKITGATYSMPSVSGSWKKSGDKWWLSYSNPSAALNYHMFAFNQWVIKDKKRYHFDSDGFMQTGWQTINGGKYYLGSSSDGAMKTGWQKISGKWYYLDPTTGIMKTGKQLIAKKYYFLDGNGVMKTGWIKDGGSWYYANSSGALQTGWKKVGSKWYYMNNQHVMQTGWLDLGSKYYLDISSGAMKTGWQKIDGKYYYFNNSGAMQKSKWVGNYYVGSDGVMATNTWIGKYYVDGNGKWVKGAKK